MRYFAVSAVFHYLGPAFAVLLFARVDVLGVAWLRIASAALVFAAWRRPWQTIPRIASPAVVLFSWRRPWRAIRRIDPLLAGWGACLALMNCCFYLAIDRLPLATVAAIEFLPVIALAALGARTPRNLGALVLAVGGVYLLTGIQVSDPPTRALGLALAFANAGLFATYIVLADRVAKRPELDGVDGLGAAMLLAAIVVTPLAGWAAIPAFGDPAALAAGIGVGLCSSVIPYVADQLALARMARATYSLMVSLLPAIATVIGVVVLTQIPSLSEVLGVAAVIGGVALHQPPVANSIDNFAPADLPADSSTASATEAIVGSPSPSPGESGRGSGPNPSSSTTIRRQPSSSTRASTRIWPGSRSR
jgi:inner membrane transporter RhtA